MRKIVLSALTLAWTYGAAAAGGTPEDLVVVRAGTLPIILSAPHGGRLDIPGVPVRSPPDAAHKASFANFGGFQPGGDQNTYELALRIASELERLTGRTPYLVVAKFRRRFIDVNRPADLGYGDAAAAPYYVRYHRSIRKFVDEIRRDYPGGLLLDVHGEGRDPDALMRGTSNGKTITQLVRRAGEQSITGGNGLFGQLESQGFKVYPPNNESIGNGSENGEYNGGYIVRTYGSQNPDGIDAVQLEFGVDYRRSDALDRTASRAAHAIVTFYEAYLETAGRQRR